MKIMFIRAASFSSRRPSSYSPVMILLIMNLLFSLVVLSESYQTSSSNNNIRTKWVSNGCSFGATNITIVSLTVNLEDEFTISGRLNYTDVPSEKVNITAVTEGVWGPYTVLNNFELNLCNVLVSTDDNAECPDDGMYEFQGINLDGLGETLSDSLIMGFDVALELIFTLDDASSSTELGCSLMTLAMANHVSSSSYVSAGYFGGGVLLLASFMASLALEQFY